MSFFKSLFGQKQQQTNSSNDPETVKAEKINMIDAEKGELEAIDEVKSQELVRIIIPARSSAHRHHMVEFRIDAIRIFELNQYNFSKHDKAPKRVFRDVELYEIPKAEFSIEDGCLTGSFQDNKFYVSDFRVVELSDRDGTPFVDINYLTVHKDSSEGRTNLFLLGGLADVSRYEQVVYYLNNITTHKSLDELEQSYLAFLKTVANKKQALMTELDTDGNGIIDIAENKDFSKLLAKRQMKILEFDKAEGKSYLHDFTKLSNYLKEKSSNVQELFSIIRENSNLSTRRYYDYVGVLRNQVHVYNLMALSAMNMIVSLAEDDRITFYEIYESFDKLNVFTSNHEREVSVRLKKIESKLDDVIQSIHEMEQNICSELITLQFISEDISDSLSGLSKGLREINSSLQVNNLLTGIQTYQMYKINKNTKPLN